MPAITYVGGDVNITSSKDLDCKSLPFEKLVSVHGGTKYTCTSALDVESSNSVSNSTQQNGGNTMDIGKQGDNPGSTRGSSRTGAIAGGVAGGLVFVMMAFVVMFLWRKRAWKKRMASLKPESVDYSRVELEQRSGPVSKQVESGGAPVMELAAARTWPRELDGGGIRQEIDGKEQQAELEGVGMAR
jgi:hypothetical protein